MSAETPFPPDSRCDSDIRIARRERLAVLCALDRAALRLTLQPRPPQTGANTPATGGVGLGSVLAVTRFFPGAIGRWSRRLSVGGGLLRALF